jgi:hypothetical protein
MLEKQGVRVRGKKVKYASNCKSHSLGWSARIDARSDHRIKMRIVTRGCVARGPPHPERNCYEKFYNLGVLTRLCSWGPRAEKLRKINEFKNKLLRLVIPGGSYDIGTSNFAEKGSKIAK